MQMPGVSPAYVPRAMFKVPLWATPGVQLCATCAGLGGIQTFMFERSDDFHEIVAFTRDMATRYHLALRELQGDFKSGLATLTAVHGVKAVILGTRRCASSRSDNAYRWSFL